MKLSIITPSFNQGAYIERCLQSVLTQNVLDLEHWVMDGGSTDDTLAILKKYAGRIQYVSRPDNGQAHAINQGLRVASGEIIGWLNSDDVYCPGALSQVLAAFKEHPEVDFIYGDANHIDGQGQVLQPYPTETWQKDRLFLSCYLCQPAVFFRKSVLGRFGFLDESLHFCMDYEYWLRCALRGAKFYYLKKILAGSRWHAQTKTATSPLQATEEALGMLKKHIGHVPVQWIKNLAVLQAKQKTESRARFIFAFLFFSSLAFRWNGFFRGAWDIATLPFSCGFVG